MSNIDFLKGSTFGVLINEIISGIDITLINSINDYNQSINNLDGDFLNLAVKSFGFNIIDNFLMNGKKFFEALPTITTFESFMALIESIFLTKEVTVNYLSSAKISLNIINHNSALLSKYTDNNNNEYIDNNTNNYYGFKEQDFLGLEAFFKKFLQPFLPAGVILDNISLGV